MKTQPTHPANDDATAATAAASNVIPLPLAPKDDKRRAEAKWSVPVMKLGYLSMPSLLLRGQGKLGLSPEQMNTLLQILEHWWKADEMPFPSKETIARRIGKSPRQIQRYLGELEAGGFIQRVGRYNGRKAQVSNYYRLDGLVEKLKAIEPEFTKAAEQNRLRRKKVETGGGGGA
jgi:hypothetical protein